MSAEPDHSHPKGKVNLQYVMLASEISRSTTNSCHSDASGAEKKEVRTSSTSTNSAPKTARSDIFLQELDTSTAILKKKKKPNSLMYVNTLRYVN